MLKEFESVVHLSNSALRGGASIAAWRLHSALITEGHQSSMLVSELCDLKSEQIITPFRSPISHLKQRIRKNLEIHLINSFKKTRSHFSPNWFGNNLNQEIEKISPSIINLHWINFAFLDISTMSKWTRPIVWTLHDMWPFTGGCHYADECTRYEIGCGACPTLRSNTQRDSSSRLLVKKKNAWMNLNLHIVSPSGWLAKSAQNSQLFRNRPIHVIPNSIDTHVFKPGQREQALQSFKLDRKNRYILFASFNGTKDPRKGFNYLKEALQKLALRYAVKTRPHILIAGATIANLPTDLPFKIHALGYLKTEKEMATAYNCADVFVAPSLSDNLPNTFLESLACGTPIAAFSVGGIPEIIDDEINGKLAKKIDSDSLSHAIQWILLQENYAINLRKNAREKALLYYSQEVQAKNYRSLYERILALK